VLTAPAAAFKHVLVPEILQRIGQYPVPEQELFIVPQHLPLLAPLALFLLAHYQELSLKQFQPFFHLINALYV
jgi:hypothetical protein